MKITPDDALDADNFDKPVIGIAAGMDVHGSGRHSHLRHQLLSSAAGGITTELEQTLCLLPPRCAVWIPAGAVRRAIMRGAMAYRSLYFSTILPLSELPLQIIEVDPLFFEVIERMAFWPWEMSAAQQSSLITVFCEEMCAVRSENWTLQYPLDPRLNVWPKGLRMGELLPRLNQLSRQVGVCERTISRIFIRDTGTNYRDWRQQFRLLKAMEMSADGCHISQVAQYLEFVNDSALIALFHQHTGTTPGRYSGNIMPQKNQGYYILRIIYPVIAEWEDHLLMAERSSSLPADAAINQEELHQANQPNLADTRLKSPTAADIFISTTVLLEALIFTTFRFNPYGYNTAYNCPQQYEFWT